MEGQLGLEPTITEYVENMVEVFRLVRELLADDGTCWVNLGDTYLAQQGAGFNGNKRLPEADRSIRVERPTGLKPKDLCGVPWRVAFALQADGWYLRQDIIWSKPNCMPESVTDRCTKAHEYIFLLSKRERYYFDQDAIREPLLSDYSRIDAWSNKPGYSGNPNVCGEKGHALPANPLGRNKRSVWTIPSQPYPDAHFATFPEKLVEPCVLAGTSERGHCPQCGKRWVRVVNVESRPNAPSLQGKYNGDGVHRTISGGVGNDRRELISLGWQPRCACGLDPVPDIVFDPFIGSGTVGQVSENLGRRWVGIDLNPEYGKLAKVRTAQMGMAL